MFVDVVFTHAEVDHIDPRKFGFIAVIDVLRATTTIVTALENGARGVVPVATPEDARELAATYDDVLLAGERKARKIAGFHLGNSPLEYVPSVVAGKLIALTTTNGTQAFQRVQRQRSEGEVGGGRISDDGAGDIESADDGTADQPTVIAACLRNAAAVAREMATANESGVSAGLLVCAGTESRFSWDDAYCAATILAEISELVSTHLGDGARAALRMLYGSTADVPTQVALHSGAPHPVAPHSAAPTSSAPGAPSAGCPVDRTSYNVFPSFDELQASKHGRRLLDMGLYRDVTFCAETSVSPVVPRLFMGMLTWEGTGGNVVNK